MRHSVKLDNKNCYTPYTHSFLHSVHSGVESEEEEVVSEDEMVDVESYSPPPDLPYQLSKVTTIMNECSAHMNLIRVAPDNPDLEMDRSAALVHAVIKQILTDVVIGYQM